jgi:hypothetical protein
MDRQLFATGQIVTVAPRSLSGPRTADHFRVVRRYPMGGKPAMYHICSLAGRAQRMVPEDELSGVMPNAFDRATRPSKVLWLFPEVVRLDGGVTA